MSWLYRPNDPGANENGMVEASPRRRVDAPYTITDTIGANVNGTWHPADGKYYDSKANFRRTTKHRGMVEIGTERQADRRDIAPSGVRKDIIEAVKKVNQGYRPHTDRGRFSGDGWQ